MHLYHNSFIPFSQKKKMKSNVEKLYYQDDHDFRGHEETKAIKN